MPTQDDGWAVAAPAEVDLDATALAGLDTFLGQWPKHNVHAVVVARRGRLAFERYFRGKERRWMAWSSPIRFSPPRKHDIRSISKSLTSLLIGAAVSEGRFPPLDSPVMDVFPEHADLGTPEKARIISPHLLTMTHGLGWNETLRWRDPANNERQLFEAAGSISSSSLTPSTTVTTSRSPSSTGSSCPR